MPLMEILRREKEVIKIMKLRRSQDTIYLLKE